MKRGQIIVVSGASGTGKGTVCKTLLRQNPDLYFSVSATTRARRPSETDGVDYHFISKQRFEQMIARNELLEYARYVDNYYGTPAAPVDAALDAGRDVLLEIEVQGALRVKQTRPDALLVFLAAPSFAELERRLRGRGDTSPESIAGRLEAARREYALASRYDYIVLNRTVAQACDEITTILTAQKYRAAYRLDTLKEEL